VLKDRLRRLVAAWRRRRADPGRLMSRCWPALEPLAPAGPPALQWAAVLRQLVRRRAVVGAGDWALARGHVELALEIARRAVQAHPGVATLRAGCRIAFNAAAIDQAARWADDLRALDPAGEDDRALMAAIAERRAVLDRLREPPRRVPVDGVRRRVACLLAYSLPCTSNGYATRSHGLLSAVAARGWEVMPYTRPGYPGDSDRSLADQVLPAQEWVGALRYGRLQEASRRRLGHMAYIQAAADEIGRMLHSRRPGIVHAASNYMTAMPACMAAQEAGLPFVYEVRGFWDVTRASSDPAFAFTSEYRFLRMFERELLRRADAVITLTPAMKQELVRRGADERRIFVAPNAVDVDALVPVPRDLELARSLALPPDEPVIGYAGSFVDYEGLELLVEAVGLLRSGGLRCHLLLVGDGLALPVVEQRVADLGLQGHVTLAGRVPHAEVARYYGLMDVCPFPRKPLPVCELVSPLKPFEAMALGKAVLVSSVSAMADAIEPGVNGHVFAKGDVADLAAKLRHMLERPAQMQALGRSARQWVRSRRTWERSAEQVEFAYEQARESGPVQFA
jgi:glycosyltransferase involved in cell wall biosynthesis